MSTIFDRMSVSGDENNVTVDDPTIDDVVAVLGLSGISINERDARLRAMFVDLPRSFQSVIRSEGIVPTL